jgi:hypothetical protein
MLPPEERIQFGKFHPERVIEVQCPSQISRHLPAPGALHPEIHFIQNDTSAFRKIAAAFPMRAS